MLKKTPTTQQRQQGNCIRPRVLGMSIDQVERAQAVQTITAWTDEIKARPAAESRVVCAANVHMVMTAHDDAGFRESVNQADLVVPDGQPLVWALRLQGLPQKRRVRVTPDLIVELLAQGERQGWSVGLYGGTAQTLPRLRNVLARRYPKLHVPYAWAPPFRALNRREDDEVVEAITRAGVDLLLVGLGCPKQERWMTTHRRRLSCVMMGVGAAFDLLSGRTREAPRWSHDVGLEWAFRLAQEPRRLWRRHLSNDPRFLALLATEAWRRRHGGSG